MRIDEICEIQSGYTARERLKASPFGVPALQLRDLGDEMDWAGFEPERFDLGEVKNRYFAGGGDVLFRSRGAINTASVIPEDWRHLAVTILPLLLLKPDMGLVRPAYLAWALNGAAAQMHFARRARGTSLRMVPRPALAELDIPLPDLATQDAILEASRLSERAYSLDLQLAELRRSLSRLQMAQAASGEMTTAARGGRA